MQVQVRRFPPVLVVAAAAVFTLLPALLRAGSAAAPASMTFEPNIELSTSQPATLWRVEPTIGANPLDPKNLVAGFFGHPDQKSLGVSCFVLNTFDAGVTWTTDGTVPLASDFDACFDPSIAADASGTFYYAYNDFHGTSQGYLTTVDIRVARSTDGGRSFTDFSTPVVGGT